MYDAKIQRLKTMIQEHNTTLDPGETALDAAVIVGEVRKAGGRNAAALMVFNNDFLKEHVPSLNGVPALRVQVGAMLTATSLPGPEDETTVPHDPAAVAAMGIPALLAAYTPGDTESAVAQRLLSLVSAERHFLVLKEDGKVDVAPTHMLFKEARQHMPERTSFTDDAGTTRRTYAIGETTKDKLVPEDPFYPGKELGLDGMSFPLKVKWNASVPLPERRMARYAIRTGSITPIVEILKGAVKLAHEPDAFAKMRAEWPDAQVMYDERERAQTHERLTVAPGGGATGPFVDGKMANRNSPRGSGAPDVDTLTRPSPPAGGGEGAPAFTGKWLSDDLVHAIHGALIDACGRSLSRGALCAGWPAQFAAGISMDGTVAEWLLGTLSTINAVGPLDNGTIPMRSFLQNARAMVRLRKEEAVVEKDLAVFERCAGVPPAQAARRLSTADIVLAVLRGSDLESFALDHVPSAHRRFSDGMDRVRKATILLEQGGREEVLRMLRQQHPEAMREAEGT